MKVCIGIQARTNSKRLPGKIYEKIGDLTLLEWVVRNCENINVHKKQNEYFLCVLGPEGDTRLEEECKRLRVPCELFPNENDVLSRYAQISKRLGAAVVRVTADCWRMEPLMIEEAVKLLADVDYTSNTVWRSFKEGLDIQACSKEAMEWFDREQTEEREHPFKPFDENATIRKKFTDQGFQWNQILNKNNEIIIKTSIDTIEELEAARKSFG